MERTLPWSWYVDPEMLRREQERIFARSWQYVGRVPEPGAFFASAAGLLPVVVTRDGAGELRAFANVCRHRGHPVASGVGKRETLQCPYHAWTYALDGRLLRAPRADEVEVEGLTLVPLRVDTWGPLVFVNPDAEAAPLEETLGDVPQRLREIGVDPAELVFHHRDESQLDANWKVICENYLECYHCAVAHPSFSRAVDVSRDTYVLEAHGTTASQYARNRADGARGQFHFVWPNLVVNVFPGTPNLSLGPVLPLTPTRSARFLDYFFPAGADEAEVAELLELDDQVGREDAALVEAVQRGVGSGALTEGVLLAESEQLVTHFQALARRALA